VCQVRTALRTLVPIWSRGGRCSPSLAEDIAENLQRTQARNARARAAHRKATLPKLHEAGIKLRDVRVCRWNI